MLRMKFLLWFVTLLTLLLAFSAQAQVRDVDVPVAIIDWNPNGKFLAVSDGEATIQIFDADSLETLNTLMPFPDLVRAVRWDDTGTWLAIADAWSIQIWEQAWDRERAALVRTLEVPLQLAFFTIESIDWNAIEEQILTISSGRIFIWDVKTGELVQTIEPYTTPLRSASWSDDGTRLAWGNTTGRISFVSVSGQQFGGEDTVDLDGVFALSWSPDSSRFAVGTTSGVIQFYGVHDSWARNALDSEGVIPDSEAAVLALYWHPESNLLAVGRADGMVEIWNIENRELVSDVRTESPVISIVWSPDGSQLAYNDGAAIAFMPMPA